MKILDQLVNKIYFLESNNIKKYIFIFFILIALLISGIQIIFLFKINFYSNKYKEIIEKRKEIFNLLKKKYYIEEKKKNLDILLTKDSNFRLKDYFLSVVSNLGIRKQVISEEVNVMETNYKKYIELSITFAVSDLNTGSLLKFLSAIESDEKVFIKEIQLKENEKKEILCNITISTLKFSEVK